MTWQNARDAVAGATLMPGAYMSIHRVHAIYNRLEQDWTPLLEFAERLKSLADEGEVDLIGTSYQMSVRFRGPVFLLPDGQKVIPVALDLENGDNDADEPVVRRSWQNVHSLAVRPGEWTFHGIPRWEP